MKNKNNEKIEVTHFSQMVDILVEEGISTKPVYCGWGLEVYHCKEKQIQVVFDCRNDNNTVTINRGF